MAWTQFFDMHSGGGCKERPYEHIYIEAPEEQARVIFYNRFGHNPGRVTCTCCGEDYSVSESPTLESATEFHRSLRSGPTVPLEEYKARDDVLIVPDGEIKPQEREGSVPDEGWAG